MVTITGWSIPSTTTLDPHISIKPIVFSRQFKDFMIWLSDARAVLVHYSANTEIIKPEGTFTPNYGILTQNHTESLIKFYCFPGEKEIIYQILSNMSSRNKGAFWWHIPLVPSGSVGCALEEEADHDKSSSAFRVRSPKWRVDTSYQQIKIGIDTCFLWNVKQGGSFSWKNYMNLPHIYSRRPLWLWLWIHSGWFHSPVCSVKLVL